jgi:HSP20 family molecular chaperone IbpA
MWSEALSLMEQAERLQRQFFRMAPATHAYAWEPPADIIESEQGLYVQIALPGVAPGAVSVDVDDEGISVEALRPFPECGSGARIHRVEIPYGRFRRRIALPLHSFQLAERSLEHGVLTIFFTRRAR